MQSDFSSSVVQNGRPSTSCKKQEEYYRSNAPFQGDTTAHSDFSPPAPGRRMPVQSKKRSKKHVETMQWSRGPKQSDMQRTQPNAVTGPLPKLPVCLTVPRGVDLSHVTQQLKGPAHTVSQSTYVKSWAGQPKPRTSYKIKEHYSPNPAPFKGESSTLSQFRAVSPRQQDTLLREVDRQAAELNHLQQLGVGVKRASNFASGAVCSDTTARQDFRPWRARPHIRWVGWLVGTAPVLLHCMSSLPLVLWAGKVTRWSGASSSHSNPLTHRVCTRVRTPGSRPRLPRHANRWM